MKDQRWLCQNPAPSPEAAGGAALLGSSSSCSAIGTAPKQTQKTRLEGLLCPRAVSIVLSAAIK